MKNFLKENWFKLVITAVIFLIGISVFYYYIIFSPKKEQIKINNENINLEQQRQKQIAEEQAAEKERQNSAALLTDCLNGAQKNYDSNWATACKTQAEEINNHNLGCLKGLPATDFSKDFCKKLWGSPDYGANCSLTSGSVAKRLDEFFQKDKDTCYTLYSQK